MGNPTDIYAQHGVDNITRKPDGEFIGNCPWCRARKDSKKHGANTFFIRADGEVWDCKTCGKSGNVNKFLSETFAANMNRASLGDLKELSASRGGLQVRTLKAWGVGFNGKQFTYPSWLMQQSGTFSPSDIRLFRLGKKPVSSAGGHAGLIMPVSSVTKLPAIKGSKTIWVCEGEWDGMAWYEALRSVGIEDDVVAVPGAGTFPGKCIPMFQGKDVVTLYDNDTPGQAGQKRTWQKLTGVVGSLRRIRWENGLPDGYDIRDLYLEHKADGASMVRVVNGFLTSEPYADHVDSSAGGTVSGGIASAPDPALDNIDPDGRWVNPDEVLASYKKWLKLDQPEMLDVVFGSVFANRMDVDPLWLFFVGPPGCGKSELLMSLSSAPMVHCSTGITNHTLISGMNFGKQDPSLLPKLIGRTWIVKDFTTVLSLNQLARDEIFSVLRDAYDGRVEKPYGNMVVRRYEGRFGIVAGVTNKIDSATAGNAVLGERFIRWRSRHKGKVLVSKDVIMQALDNLSEESQMRNELKDIARKVLNRPIERKHYPNIPKWFKERVVELAQWVAVMRGVIEREKFTGSTGVISAKPQPEIATRLAKQFCTLALGIGVYRGLKELDEYTYKIIAQVGCDTCPDRSEEVIRSLYILGGRASTKIIADDTRFPYDTVRWVLQDMDLLGIVKREKGSEGSYVLHKPVHAVLKRMKIYEEDHAWRWSGLKA